MKKIVWLLLLALIASAAVSCEKKPENIQEPVETTTAPNEYANLVYSDYLSIPDLSSIKAPISEVDAEWDTFVQRVRFENIVLTEAAATDTAALNDQVNIHYTGYSASDDVVISEATLANMTNASSANGYDLILGSNSFIGAYESAEHPEKNNKSFEEQLIGMKAGEKRTITVTFPDNYGSVELNGTVVKFDVTVNSLKKGTLPELTDDMVATYTSNDYTSVDALKESVYSYYKNEIAYTYVEDAFKIKSYPEALIDSAIAQYVTDYISYTYDEELTDEEAKTVFDEQYDNALANAEQVVGQRMILEYLFSEFEVTLTEDEYAAKLDAEYNANAFYYLYNFGMEDSSALEEFYGKDYLFTRYRFEILTPLLAEAITFE